MSVTITLPTRNNLLWLKECIKTLRWYTDLNKNKLLVFNNNCTDGTSEFLHSENINTINSMTQISSELNTNILINKAMQDKNCEYICYIHDDMIFTKNWLNILLEEIKNQKDCFLLGCKIIAHTKAYLIPDKRRLRIAGSLKEDFTGSAGCPLLLFTRECIEKVGYFDEGFAWGEKGDNDYYKRIEDSGHKFLLTHKTVIFHCERMIRKQEKSFTENLQRTAAYFLKKHNGADYRRWGIGVIKYEMVDNEVWKTWNAK